MYVVCDVWYMICVWCVYACVVCMWCQCVKCMDGVSSVVCGMHIYVWYGVCV